MKTRIAGKDVLAQYLSGGRFSRIPGAGGELGGDVVEIDVSGIRWLLRDEFTTAMSAGSVNGTYSEPSGHLRTVVDANSKLSLTGGFLTYAAGGAGNYVEPYLDHGAIIRIAGRVGIQKFFTGATLSLCGIGFAGSRGNYTYDVMNGLFYSGSVTLISQVGSNIGVGPVLATNTAYTTHTLLRTSGHALILKGGIYTYPTLLYISNTSTTANQYLGAAISIASPNLQLYFYRIPEALYLPTPLLSTSGAMTWPTTNGLGHAEGVAGGLGAGGSGLTMTDMGSWAAGGTYVVNTPVVGAEMVVDGGMSDASKWTTGTGWDVGVTTPGKATHSPGTASNLLNIGGVASVVGKWYSIGVDVVLAAGQVNLVHGFNTFKIFTATTNYSGVHRSATAGAVQFYSYAAFDGSVDNLTSKPIPISSLITNVALSTTDVLAEQIIHAYTLGSQVGWVQADRSFAAKCASTAAAGQAVLALKEIGDASATGLTTNDTVTIKHAGGDATYTIASIAGGSNVAYNDTTKTQTVTLGSNLSEEVAADAKVGLDWKAWNGTLTYYDGVGNINFDKIVAGVYTNLGTTAKSFVADTRLIVRKIGTEYRVFAQEALIGTAITTVDAAAMAGKYWGLFSTLAANQITSTVVHDTGNVTDAHAILNKYSFD